MYFLRLAGTREFYLGDNALCIRVSKQTKVYSTPARGRLIDPDLFSRAHPIAWQTLAEIKAVLLRIFKDQHPADQQRNRLLCRNAKGRGPAVDARNLSRR